MVHGGKVDIAGLMRRKIVNNVGERVYSYRQEELRSRENNVDELKALHIEDFCGMCKKLVRDRAH